MHILAFSGSLQTRSTNTALVHLAAAHSGERLWVDVFDHLDALPYFNPDLDDDDDGPPAAVAELRERAAAADAILICTPEYAHEMPGVLKNALDWLVRSGELYGKPVAILSGAPSADRGIYAREALERTLTTQGARVVTSRTVAVPRSAGSPQQSVPEVERAIIEALEALRSAALTAYIP
jgi:NAD(P)H-dependent FMN reductase